MYVPQLILTDILKRQNSPHPRPAGTVELLLHLFFSLAPDGCEWLVSGYSYFLLGRYFLYTLNRRLGGSQTWCGSFVREKNPSALLGIEPLTVQPAAQTL